jgi:hypothetical protein
VFFNYCGVVFVEGTPVCFPFFFYEVTSIQQRGKRLKSPHIHACMYACMYVFAPQHVCTVSLRICFVCMYVCVCNLFMYL